jgi:hypothetical protein
MSIIATDGRIFPPPQRGVVKWVLLSKSGDYSRSNCTRGHDCTVSLLNFKSSIGDLLSGDVEWVHLEWHHFPEFSVAHTDFTDELIPLGIDIETKPQFAGRDSHRNPTVIGVLDANICGTYLSMMRILDGHASTSSFVRRTGQICGHIIDPSTLASVCYYVYPRKKRSRKD